MLPRWVKPLVFAAIVIIGWVFVLWQNHFHVTPPIVFVCIGFLAVTACIYNLWRTGAAVASPDDELASWTQPVGPRGELEREKRTLLKAIKEAEFDHQMGKLSKTDCDHMVAVYRARAIELIKALEATDGKASVRDQIERELRARLEVESKTADKAAAKKPKKKAPAKEATS